MSHESLAELTSMDEAMSPTDKRQVELEKKAGELFGEKGLNLAIKLFLDNPNLNETEFWTIFENQLKRH